LSVSAIALDTNGIGSGKLNLQELARFAEAMDAHDLYDAEIWIPEPVLWEWAEHAYSQLSSASTIYRKAAKELRAAGIEIDEIRASHVHDVESAVAAIEDGLDDIEHVRVLRLKDHSAAAEEGLRDQILQIGTGRRKPDGRSASVKTGGADGASFRLIEAAAEDYLPAVVVVSADRDARSYFSGHDGPIIVGSLREALRGVELLPNDEELTEALRESFQQALLASNGVELTTNATLENGWAAFKSDAAVDDDLLSSEVSVKSIGEILSIEDIEVTRRESYASATAIARIDLLVEGVRWNDVDDELVHIWSEQHDVTAELQVSAYRDESVWTVEITHIVVS